MSRIDKLSISGVRSFDHRSAEAIHFYSPLTLIVGYNGSGKTTVIECLKYATTGDLPPNSKGGAFIHDPKLAGEKEVLAQVKAAFKSTSGARMVVTRNLQLTVKKASRSQKTLECSLNMLKNGERVTVSSRVAELDQILPQYLGVSKAILENVIFCHQDDSLWPMSEPSVLKKKFDEIFEAMKYTKAIDNIKVLRKKQTEELAKLKIIEQHAKDDKDKGDRAETKSNELSNSIEEMRSRRDALGEELEEAQRKSAEAYDKMSTFELVVSSLESKRKEASYKESNVNDLKHNIKHMLKDSDQDLEDQLKKHDDVVQSYDGEWRSLEMQNQDLAGQMNEARNNLSEKQHDHGRLQGAKDRYEQQLVQRQTLVRETAARHDIRGFDGELDDQRVKTFMDRISKMAQEQNASFEKARRDFQAEFHEAQVKLNEHNEQKSIGTSTKESTRAQISANDRKLADFQRKLDQIDIDEGSAAQYESALRKLEEQLASANQKAQAHDWDKQIQDTEKTLRDFRSKADRVKQELFQVHQRAEEAAQVDLLQKQAAKSSESLETMKGAHAARLASVLGDDWDSGDLETQYSQALDRQNKQIQEAESARNSVHSEYREFDIKLSAASQDIQRKKKEMNAAAEQLAEVVDDPLSFPEELARAEEARDGSKSDLEGSGHVISYYKSALQILDSKDCCRMCQRNFKSKSEGEEFRKRLKDLISKSKVEEMQTRLQQDEEELKSLRDAIPAYETWKRLSQTEVGQAEALEQQLKPRREELLQKVESHDGTIAELRDAKREIESLSKTIQNMAKYDRDTKTAERNLHELAAKSSQSANTKSLDDIKQESDKVEREMNDCEGTLSKLQAGRDRARAQSNELQMEIRDARARVDRSVMELKEKTFLSDSVEELVDANRKAREQIKTVDKDLEAVSRKIAEAKARCDEINARSHEKETELQNNARSLESSVNELKLAEREIREFIEQGGLQSLQQSKREMDASAQSITSLEAEKSKLVKDMNALNEKRSNQEGVRDNISQNLRHRQQCQQLETLRRDISELESQNAERDRNHWAREANKWQHERELISAAKESITGQMKAMDDQLAQLIQDWTTDYRDAAYKYKEAHIKVEATKAAIEDLGRYGSALDKAIMKYHSLKMEEINRIIEELWRKTYQGTDVDSILIRSDNENLKGNKSYNYRVCMVKQDAEMDMRGRCSAGQRVLASIIIRLALAECFGVNCGLIALDEPTTNLDHVNIVALAKSLHDIIRMRKKQSNFQLIVITHDEEFLKAMQCQDFCDWYFKIKRSDTQKSLIVRMPMSDLLD